MEDWESVRLSVLSSPPLSNILRTLETYQEKDVDPAYLSAISQRERVKSPQEKSRYQVAKELKKTYPGVARDFSRLEGMGLVASEEVAGRQKAKYSRWTLKSTFLFPEFAPPLALAGLYTKIFGRWVDCAAGLSAILNCPQDEVLQALLKFLCWRCRDLVRWVRENVIFPRAHSGWQLSFDDHAYCRELAAKYLAGEYLLNLSDPRYDYYGEIFRGLSEDAQKLKSDVEKGLIRVYQYISM